MYIFLTQIAYFSIRFFIDSPLTRIRLAWILLRRFNFFRNLWKFESNEIIMLSFIKKVSYLSIRFFICSSWTRTRLAEILLRGFNFFRNFWERVQFLQKPLEKLKVTKNYNFINMHFKLKFKNYLHFHLLFHRQSFDQNLIDSNPPRVQFLQKPLKNWK